MNSAEPAILIESIPNIIPEKKLRGSLKLGLLLMVVLAAVVTLGPLLVEHSPTDQGDLLTERYLAPSPEHPFGTDKFARDVFSRVLNGGRISLIIALSVVLLSMTIGLAYGTIAGYAGGIVDAFMMRFLDFLLAFPAVFLTITVIALFDMNHWYLIPILSLTGWMESARIVRAETLSLKEREFILATKALGYSHARILVKHIMPNALGPVIVAATFKVGEIILLESALSFFGLGVQPPDASWGNIIQDGRHVLFRAWWISTFPGLFILLAVTSVNLVGEKLQSLFTSVWK